MNGTSTLTKRAIREGKVRSQQAARQEDSSPGTELAGTLTLYFQRPELWGKSATAKTVAMEARGRAQGCPHLQRLEADATT